MLETSRALFLAAIAEAGPNPSKKRDSARTPCSTQ